MSVKPAKPERPAPRFRRYEAADRKQQLIEAAIGCLAEGGIAAFTIDQVCRRAGISRGLISHHFNGKDALLAAAYDVMTDYLDDLSAAGIAQPTDDPAAALRDTIEANFATDLNNQPTVKAWLAVWGEVAGNAQLKAVHRKRYDAYRANLTGAIAAVAKARGHKVDAGQLAMMFIALIDGLWLEWCLDPDALPQDDAKAACYALLEPHLGSLRV